MHILNIETFLLAILVLTLTPGIDTALVIKNSSRSGAQQGVLTSLGICLGLFVHAFLSAVGISAILIQSAQLFLLIKWIGAAYLIYLGIGALNAAYRGEFNFDLGNQETKRSAGRRAIKEGFLSNLLNPKTAVFYLAFLPQFINPHYSAFIQAMLMATLHFMIAMLWQCVLAGAVSSAKRVFASTTAMRWMEATTGSILVILGAGLMLDSHSR